MLPYPALSRDVRSRRVAPVRERPLARAAAFRLSWSGKFSAAQQAAATDEVLHGCGSSR